MQTTTGTRDDAARTATETSVESVLYALMSIGRVLRQRVVGDPLDPSLFWLLKGLAGHGALRVTELANYANLDASTVSRHVQQLQRSGLIERTQDPADGRAQQVALTAEGRDLLRSGMERRRELLSHSLDDWSTEDVEAFDRLLSRFVRNLENNEHTTELEHA